MTQLTKLKRLLTKKTGCTSVDICRELPSVTPHRRLADLKQQGWTIKHKKVGKLLRYYGEKPNAGI